MKQTVIKLLGMTSLRHYYLRKIALWVRRRVKLFKELQTIDSETKQRLFRRVRHHEKVMAQFELWGNTIEYSIPAVLYIPVFLCLVGVLLVVKQWLNVSYSLLGWIGIFYLYSSVCFLASWVIFWYRPLPYLQSPIFKFLAEFKSIRIWWPITALGVFGLLLTYLVANTGVKPPGVLTFVIVAGTMAAPVTFLVGIVSKLLLYEPIIQTFLKKGSSFCPEAILVDTFLVSLSDVEKKPHKWGDANFIKSLEQTLDAAAVCIEYGLFRKLRNNFADIRMWRRKTKQISAALRLLMNQVHSPKSDTRDQFIQQIALSLTCTVEGLWGDMPQVESEQSPKSKSYTFLLRRLALSLFPFLIFLSIQWTPVAIQGETAEWVKVGTIAWAVLSLLQPLDPELKTKIDILKSILQLLRKDEK